LALGAVLYVALTWSGQPVDPASRSIDVSAQDQAELSLAFERVMGRAPTDAELDARIEQFVRDEVLYREALRLGLDQGDAVVRQRMVAKMDMSASAAAETAEPGEAILREFYETNPERYAGRTLLSFDQVYFAKQADAEENLGRAEVSGEAISLPAEVNGLPLSDVQSRFGEVFARAVFSLDAGEDWQGPVPSGFGWHLVKLRERQTETAFFAAERVRFENDWRSAEIASRKDKAFEVLRSAYRIEIDR
jgi:hypothetical protein